MEITTRVLNFSFDTYFKTPLLHKNADCDTVARRAFEAFASYGLRPTQIIARRGDEVFNFDVSFPLLNGNATFKLASEVAEIRVQNAASDADLEIVVDCVAKFYEHVPLPDISFTAVTVNAQATAPSVDETQQYLLQYAKPAKGISQGGVIAYSASILDWPEEIRFAVDRSIVFPHGLFLVWTTKFTGGKMTRDVLNLADRSFREIAKRCDLVFPEPNKR